MSIWEIIPDVNNYYKLAHDKADWKTLTYSFDGTSVAPHWIPLEVYVEHSDETLQWGDFPALVGTRFALNEKAFSHLEKILSVYGELLPLKCTSPSYEILYAYNPLSILDCIDKAKSTISRFDDGRVMWVHKPVFIADCVGDVPIFKIPENKLNRVFVTDTFKQIVDEQGLEGLVFTIMASE
jgi:hypothetical protein